MIQLREKLEKTGRRDQIRQDAINPAAQLLRHGISL
jgi:hypothetical protein